MLQSFNTWCLMLVNVIARSAPHQKHASLQVRLGGNLLFRRKFFRVKEEIFDMLTSDFFDENFEEVF